MLRELILMHHMAPVAALEAVGTAFWRAVEAAPEEAVRTTVEVEEVPVAEPPAGVPVEQERRELSLQRTPLQRATVARSAYTARSFYTAVGLSLFDMYRLMLGVLGCVALLGLVIYGMHRSGQRAENIAENISTTSSSSTSTSTQELLDQFAASHAPTSHPRTPPQGFSEYHNLKYHFSLFYPTSLPAVEYMEENGGYTVSFQGKPGQPGFQIYIVPYSESKVSEKQFKLDEPSGVMKAPSNMEVDGVFATRFYSANVAMGDTLEVWFIRGGYLYEVTTYKQLETSLIEILKTWKFI